LVPRSDFVGRALLERDVETGLTERGLTHRQRNREEQNSHQIRHDLISWCVSLSD
jgi:hypothetical protein